MKTIHTEVEFDLKDVVFCKTDTYQTPGFVTAIVVRPGATKYEVNYVGMTKEFFGFELSKEKNITGEIPTAGKEPFNSENKN